MMLPSKSFVLWAVVIAVVVVIFLPKLMAKLPGASAATAPAKA